MSELKFKKTITIEFSASTQEYLDYFIDKSDDAICQLKSCLEDSMEIDYDFKGEER